MRAAEVLLFSIVVSLNGCSTIQQGVVSRSEIARPAQEPSPIGTFVGTVMKVRLDPDGTYVAEDIGPPEFWTMVEGHTAYPQRIKWPPQRGHWSWDGQTGQLTMAPEASESFRWDTAHLRYDKSSPDRLAWGDYAFLERSRE